MGNTDRRNYADVTIGPFWCFPAIYFFGSWYNSWQVDWRFWTLSQVVVEQQLSVNLVNFSWAVVEGGIEGVLFDCFLS